MIKGIYADLIVSAYLLGSLFLRFSVEDALVGHPLLSIFVGVFMLLFIWALIKSNILVPDYFGLLKPRKKA